MLSVVLSLVLVAVVKCQENQPVAAVECFAAVSTGDCRARLPSFYYNLQTGSCDCFIFGGCNAQGNIFSTLEACMNTCAVQPRFQSISSNCVGIFGVDSPKFSLTPRDTTPRPISFSSTTNPPPAVTNRPVVTTRAPPVTAAPITNAPTTRRTTTTRRPTTTRRTTTTTSRTSRPSKPADSTPGPWDHWLNL